MILEIFLESWKRTLGFNLCCRPPPLPSDLPLDRAFSFMRPLYHIWTNPCEHLSPQTISVFRWGLNEGGIAWKLNRFISTSAWSVHLILVWPLNLLVMALCHYKTKVVLFHCHVWGGLLPGWGISQARSLAAGQISQAEMFCAVSHPDQVRASTVRVDNWLKNWEIRNLFNWPYYQESYNLKLCLGFSTVPRSEEEQGCTLATLSPSLLGPVTSISWCCGVQGVVQCHSHDVWYGRELPIFNMALEALNPYLMLYVNFQ